MSPLKAILASNALFSPAAMAAGHILLVAGPASHGPGMHEHPAGCELLAKHLETSGLPVTTEVSLGWPKDPAKVAAADTIVVYCDGQGAHSAGSHLDALKQHYQAGKGLAMLHYALEPKDQAMAGFFDQALGGRFEVNWSVNPVWKMTGPIFSKHDCSHGVESFEITEEFYYHLRLRDDVTPVLSAVPPLSSLGNDGPRSGNPAVRKALADKIPQTLGWIVENPNGSRGFGFTGGHFHANWSHDQFRKIVLNAIIWTSGIDVPQGGVVGKVAPAPVYQTIDIAIAKGDLGDVKLHITTNPESLDKGATEKSRAPLEQAILRKKTDIALFLIESSAEINIVNSSQRTPLHLAVQRKNPEIVEALMKAGAKPDLLDKDGWTPLHHAAAKNELESATILIDGGANAKALSGLGGTPLHEAAASGGPEIIELILKQGVDPSIKSKTDVTALDIAKEYKNEPAIKILSGL